jgi:hypothetical protein
MASTILIKRSLTTAVPSSLANGEPAFSSNGDILFLGANGQIVPIGGKRVPGTLTANQALVTDANNMIDKLMFGNSTINSISNSSVFQLSNSTVTFTLTKPTSVQQAGSFYLHANGSWVSVASSSPGGANTQIQFNDSTALNGTAGFTFDKTTNNVIIANTLTVGGTTIANSTVLQVGANVILNSSSMFVGNSTVNATQTNISYGLANSTVTSNLQTGALNIGANVNLNTSTIFVGNSTVNAFVNSTTFQIANSSGTANLTPTTLTVQNFGGSQVNTAANLAVSSANVSMPNANLAVKDLNVSGNLIVSGTVTSVDATNLTVSDSLIKLAKGNAGTTLDIGFYGAYNDGSARFAGLAWDASAALFELFANTTVEPTTTIDTAGAGYVRATLRTFLNTGALISNSTVTNITANSTLSVALVANSLTLSSALGAGYGGTGQSTVTRGDLLAGNSTSGWSKLAVGTSGKVLQSDGTDIIYGDIDGGTF